MIVHIRGNCQENINPFHFIIELQRCEEDNSPPIVLSRTDSLGIIARMLLEDLKLSIQEDKFYLVYQPQMDSNGRYISKSLEKYNVPASNLWIEITEQDVISNSDYVIQKLKRLKNAGHTLLIDDFGMGHTSLIYLQSTYFGVVKLDGSLVKNMLDNTANPYL